MTILFILQSILLICITFPLARLSTAISLLGNETDRLALLSFKDSVTQYPQGRLNSWNDSIHFCDWEGVTCSHRHQKVTKLMLRSQGLTGSISPYIGNLSFLRYINLGNNSLYDHIPPEIGRLFRLQVLLISNNSFTGHIPVNLSQCSDLEALTIGYNNLTGKIPEEIGSLSKLTVLDLHVNSLRGEIPVSLGNCTLLETIYLSTNSLEGSIPESVGKLKLLRNFLVALNMLSGTVPPSLYNISSLAQISLAKNQLVGMLPHNIGLFLPNLLEIYIGANKFFGPIPVSLFSNASKIQKLYMGENNFTGNVPIEVGNLVGLEYLHLGQNQLGSNGKDDDLRFITSLKNCSHLQLLDIAINHLGGRLTESLANLSIELNALAIGGNPLFGSIPSDIWKLESLQSFAVEDSFLTGPIPEAIGRLQNLQNLVLTGNRLSGPIPYSIGNLTALYFLALSNNMLDGNVVTSFEKCESLQVLYMENNRLTGTVPKEVLGLTSQLAFIRLSNNSFTGSLPSEVGQLKFLRGLDLSENKLTGDIPSTLSSCSGLESLYLQGNLFQGPIPSSFVYLKGLDDIDLSRNNLSGKIPIYLQDLALEHLNLSFNNFEGEVPTRGIFENVSAFSVAGNSKLCGGTTKLYLQKCHNQKNKQNGMHLSLKIVLGVLVPLLVIISLLLAFYWRKRSGGKTFSRRTQNHLQRVSYKELRDATNGFSPDNLIGTGSHGSVYKGVLPRDKRLVAVKVLNLMEKGASKSFIAECKVLREVRHRNLLKILTLCSSVNYSGNDFKALIFEFMPNGSLESWLHPSQNVQDSSRNLNFLQRLNIVIDIASALDYLHNGCPAPIVHCDLKPSNVLLDNDMVAYVGDFGLVKFLCQKSSTFDKGETTSVGIRGTIGYIPPEYGMGAEVSIQGDVYSYGIILMEIFTGKRPTDTMFEDELSLRIFCTVNSEEEMMGILDARLCLENDTDEINMSPMTEQMKKSLADLLQIGVACSSESRVDRVHIKDVLMKLHRIREDFVGNKEKM